MCIFFKKKRPCNSALERESCRHLDLKKKKKHTAVGRRWPDVRNRKFSLKREKNGARLREKKKLSSYFITFRLVRPKFLNPKSAHVEEVKICCCFFLNIWYLRNQQEWTNENKEHTHTQSVNHFLSTLFFSITTDAKWEGHISTWDFYRNKEVDIRFCLISICAGRRRRKSMCRPLFQFL